MVWVLLLWAQTGAVVGDYGVGLVALGTDRCGCR